MKALPRITVPRLCEMQPLPHWEWGCGVGGMGYMKVLQCAVNPIEHSSVETANSTILCRHYFCLNNTDSKTVFIVEQMSKLWEVSTRELEHPSPPTMAVAYRTISKSLLKGFSGKLKPLSSRWVWRPLNRLTGPKAAVGTWLANECGDWND